MSYIRSVRGRQILDSRGEPTVEVEIMNDRQQVVRASVPSGASTGEQEAYELRDGDEMYYHGRGVLRAVEHLNGPIAELLIGESVYDQESLDLLMKLKDGTPNKQRFGANAILAASLAIARLGALSAGLPLYKYLGGTAATRLPCPMMNIINGGAHAGNNIDFQEFMIRPKGAPTIKDAIRWGSEIFHTLKNILKKRNYHTGVGDEGGFAPHLKSDEEALDLIVEAIEQAGYQVGSDVTIALDCAASSFYDRFTGRYIERKRQRLGEAFVERTTDEQIDYLKHLAAAYPIDSIEDGLSEWDWDGWERLTAALGDRIQIVGDDLFVTNIQLLHRGILKHIANAILIKPNQIGTVSETLATVHEAHTHAYRTIISHRSGETEDTFIADLSVATQCGQIKTGSLSRSDRVSKYNRLMAIEEEMGSAAHYNAMQKSPIHPL